MTKWGHTNGKQWNERNKQIIVVVAAATAAKQDQMKLN